MGIEALVIRKIIDICLTVGRVSPAKVDKDLPLGHIFTHVG